VTCRVLSTLAFIFALGLAAHGQQTIFNVPSADLTDPHTFYFERESQFRAWPPGRYWFGTVYFAYGDSACVWDTKSRTAAEWGRRGSRSK